MMKGFNVELALRRSDIRREREECRLLIDPLTDVL